MAARLILLFLFIAYVQQGTTGRRQVSSTGPELTYVSLMPPSDLNYTVSKGQPMAATMTLTCTESVAWDDDYISVVLYKQKLGRVSTKHEVGSYLGLSDRCLANKYCLDVRIAGLELVTTIIIADAQFRDSGEYIVSVKTRKKEEEQFLDQGSGRFQLKVIQGENSTEQCICRRRKKRGRKPSHKVEVKQACHQDGNTDCP